MKFELEAREWSSSNKDLDDKNKNERRDFRSTDALVIGGAKKGAKKGVKKIICAFCEEEHYSNKCTKHAIVKERRE